MKKCSRCKKRLSLALYYKRRIGKRIGEHYAKCKECMKQRGRRYYHENKKRQLPLARARRRRYYKAKRKYIHKVKNVPCIDCGIKYPYCVMDFDHKHRKDKVVDVSRAVGANWSLERIKKEVLKCDIVCANCHRIRTHKHKLR